MLPPARFPDCRRSRRPRAPARGRGSRRRSGPTCPDPGCSSRLSSRPPAYPAHARARAAPGRPPARSAATDRPAEKADAGRRGARPADIGPRAGADRTRSGLRSELRLDEGTQCADAGMLEYIGHLDQPRPEPLDTLVNRDQFERTRTEIEQALIEIDTTPLELGFTDAAQLGFDRAVPLGGAWPRTAETLELGQLGIEGTGQILLLEQMPLHLAARGLRDAAHRHDGVELEPGLLAQVAPMQHEHQQQLGLRPGRPDSCHHDLAELQARNGLGDALEIVRIVVLAVDEQDLLVAAGDVQLALKDQPQIAGAQPAIGGESRGVGGA